MLKKVLKDEPQENTKSSVYELGRWKIMNTYSCQVQSLPLWAADTFSFCCSIRELKMIRYFPRKIMMKFFCRRQNEFLGIQKSFKPVVF